MAVVAPGQGVGGENRRPGALPDAEPGARREPLVRQVLLQVVQAAAVVLEVVDGGAAAAGEAVARQVPEHYPPAPREQALQQVAIEAEVVEVAVHDEGGAEGRLGAPDLGPEAEVAGLQVAHVEPYPLGEQGRQAVVAQVALERLTGEVGGGEGPQGLQGGEVAHRFLRNARSC